MKSKPLVYLLGFLVLCIWGVIVYRVFLSVREKGSDRLQLASTGKINKVPVPKLYPDTFKLLLNYPDPFTGALAKMPDTAGIKNLVGKTTVPGAAPVQAPDPVLQMKYLGFVADGRGNRRVAIMSYQGAEMMMHESDTLKGVKIMVIKKDGVLVRYHGKTTLIKTE
ncbi:hypothetical protein [Pedobacter ginsengisoli]|uniref:hypothetical protein n=1 Tax=Pedobacter ginsengisoli TaxID=363852 RepID=UPI0025511665|nr:hypothetical protein [Pedobacter ginsengisoli]